MKILAVECSAGPASAAVIEDGHVCASAFVNIKLTHSQTLLPMIEGVLGYSMSSMDEIDGIAVASGPGSFTGIRIGISAVKGLAAARKIPCVSVSTLRGMAESFRQSDCFVCAVMDARCNQVYNALFALKNGEVIRLCEDRALMCNELAEEVNELASLHEAPFFVVGDGADLFYPFVEKNPQIKIAKEPLKYQNAVGVGLAAYPSFLSGDTVSAEQLLPVYLRLPQAERELAIKKKQTERK